MIEWGLERAVAQFKILEAAGRIRNYALSPRTFGNPELIESPGGSWTFIEKPIPGYPYLLTGDPAEGLDDSNHSAAIIWKPSSLGGHRAIGYLNQVISIEEFEANEFAAGMLYNRAVIMNESNNGGIAVNSLLARDGYQNLYRMPHSAKGELTGRHEHRYGFWSGDTSKKIALTTLTRGLNDAFVSGGIRLGSLDIPIPEVWDQLRTFSHLGANKVGGAAAPDDLVSCCWLGAWELIEGLTISAPRNDYPLEMFELKNGDKLPPDRLGSFFPEKTAHHRRRFA
jgi:hypothetical protein